jgi:hypothetical protein
VVSFSREDDDSTLAEDSTELDDTTELLDMTLEEERAEDDNCKLDDDCKLDDTTELEESRKLDDDSTEGDSSLLLRITSVDDSTDGWTDKSLLSSPQATRTRTIATETRARDCFRAMPFAKTMPIGDRHHHALLVAGTL